LRLLTCGRNGTNPEVFGKYIQVEHGVFSVDAVYKHIVFEVINFEQRAQIQSTGLDNPRVQTSDNGDFFSGGVDAIYEYNSSKLQTSNSSRLKILAFYIINYFDTLHKGSAS
jgi:hypothetical protein